MSGMAVFLEAEGSTPHSIQAIPRLSVIPGYVMERPMG